MINKEGKPRNRTGPLFSSNLLFREGGRSRTCIFTYNPPWVLPIIIGAPPEIRTPTVPGLNRLPLPIGLEGHNMVRLARLELARYYYREILSLPCLPIPSQGHGAKSGGRTHMVWNRRGLNSVRMPNFAILAFLKTNTKQTPIVKGSVLCLYFQHLLVSSKMITYVIHHVKVDVVE